MWRGISYHVLLTLLTSFVIEGSNKFSLIFSDFEFASPTNFDNPANTPFSLIMVLELHFVLTCSFAKLIRLYSHSSGKQDDLEYKTRNLEKIGKFTS